MRLTDNVVNKQKVSDNMADDNIAERVARLEAKLNGAVAYRADVVRLEAALEGKSNCSDLVRVEERAAAAERTANNFITLKSYHNDLLESRTRKVEDTISSINVKIAELSKIEDLEEKVQNLETSVSGINVKMALLAFIGSAAFLGVIGVAFEVIKGAVR